MSATTAKICGLSTPEAVSAAVGGGASHIGFVFFGKSPRNIAPELARRLAEPLRGRSPVSIVALMVDPGDADVAEAMRVLNPDLIQLHGQETPERTAAIKAL